MYILHTIEEKSKYKDKIQWNSKKLGIPVLWVGPLFLWTPLPWCLNVWILIIHKTLNVFSSVVISVPFTWLLLTFFFLDKCIAIFSYYVGTTRNIYIKVISKTTGVLYIIVCRPCCMKKKIETIKRVNFK